MSELNVGLQKPVIDHKKLCAIDKGLSLGNKDINRR